MPPPVNIANQRFGRLLALYPTEQRAPQGHIMWRCRCDCGGETLAPAAFLRNGCIRSCGCLNKENIRRLASDPKTKAAVSAALKKRNFKHGHSRRGQKSRTYRIWSNLPLRWHRYPITPPICERWRSFETFLADMGECPSERHTIERNDNAKGYEPGNCRWATMKEQQNNRTNNRRITHDGRTQTLQQWADETGLRRETIARRIDVLAWSIPKALTHPVRKQKRRELT